MKQIPLTQGKFALVDDEDYERVNQYKWHASRAPHTYYASRKIRLSLGQKRIGRMQRMHHFIIGHPPIGFETDHIDGKGLNNQKYNLRFVTHRQNLQNWHHPRASIYPGVSLDKNSSKKKWVTQIMVNNNKIYLGRFFSEEEAYKAYLEVLEFI